MITLSSVDELQATEAALEKIKYSYPELFNKLLHVVALTRALQFKYQFMGTLIMDENPDEYTPEFVMPSVIGLYRGSSKLKDDPNIRYYFRPSPKLKILDMPKSVCSCSVKALNRF